MRIEILGRGVSSADHVVITYYGKYAEPEQMLRESCGWHLKDSISCARISNEVGNFTVGAE